MNHIPPEEISGAIICSVVPPVNRMLMLAAEMVIGKTPILIRPGIRTGLKLMVDNPNALGSDRIVDTVAAYHLYGKPAGRTVIVVDMGTMTTLSVVSKIRNFSAVSFVPASAFLSVHSRRIPLSCPLSAWKPPLTQLEEILSSV